MARQITEPENDHDADPARPMPPPPGAEYNHPIDDDHDPAGIDGTDGTDGTVGTVGTVEDDASTPAADPDAGSNLGYPAPERRDRPLLGDEPRDELVDPDRIDGEAAVDDSDRMDDEAAVEDGPAASDVEDAPYAEAYSDDPHLDDPSLDEGHVGDDTAEVLVDDGPAAAAVTPAGTVRGGLGANLLSSAEVDNLERRWLDIKLRFVDDPGTAAGRAEDLVDEVLAALTSALRARKDAADDWNRDSDSVEAMLGAVRGYRDLLDQLLGFGASTSMAPRPEEHRWQ